MEVAAIEAIVGGWNAQNVRCIVAGGLAVVAHDKSRLTPTLEFILDDETENQQRTNLVLRQSGYKATATLHIYDSLLLSNHRKGDSLLEIDVFPASAEELQNLRARSEQLHLSSFLTVHCLNLQDFEATGRSKQSSGIYRAHRREQLRRIAARPFAEKLQWLEDAHRLALHFEAQRQKNKGASTCREEKSRNLTENNRENE